MNFVLEILRNIFITAVVNIFPSVILLLIGEAIGLTDYLQDLTYKLWKRREDRQIICYSITLPFVIYFLSRPMS